MMNGIDVSKWQGNSIDWAKVKAAGIDYAILRAGYGSYISQKDSTFERNYAECKRLGIPVGVYWYVYAKTLAGIKQEVKTLLEAIKGKQFEYPIYLDIENEAQASMTKAALTQMIETGCTALEQAGYFAGVYTYTSFASYMDYAGLAKKYTMWLADYRKNYNTTLTRDMHQYTSTGNVAGIGGRVDCNRAYVDFPAIIRAAGKNGFEKEDNTMYSDTLKIGPVSGGDRKTMAALAESLNLPHVDAGDYVIVGPASDGDRKQIVAKAQSLGLGVENYLPPEPEAPEEPETPETPDVPDMEFDEVMFMLVKLGGKLDRVLEKLELVQQALEDPAAQQVLDKLTAAGAALSQ